MKSFGSLVANFMVFILWSALCIAEEGPVAELSSSNWTLVMEGEWMLEFFAPWCPACNALQATWKKLGYDGEKLGFSVGKIDVTLSPGLSGRFMVTALPTIFHIKEGVFRNYRGSRKINDLVSFVKEEKWKLVEPIPSWKSPSSMLMSVLSYFFEASQILRDVHSTLHAQYGLPVWFSYCIFALLTILIGGLIGLFIVLIVDCVFPPKPQGTPEKSKKDDGGYNTDDEVAASDELIDDVSVQSDTGDETNAVKKRRPRKVD